MGGAPTAFSLRMRAARQKGKTFDVVEHCHSIALSAAETSLSSMDTDFVKRFRRRAEEYNMRVVLNAPRP